MSHFNDPYAPPLAPKIKVERPPWVPSYKEYNGRADWWTDNGSPDELRRTGVTRLIHPRHKEWDKIWWDPKVPDGTSLSGPYGLDSQNHKNFNQKADQPGTLYEHQKKLRENSIQYQNIIKKWDISKEHPGIAVDLNLDSQRRSDSFKLGLSNFKFFHFYNRFGPTFWEKPINEGCVEKGFALAKFAFIGTVFYSLMDASNFQGRGIIHDIRIFQPRKIFKNWITKHFPIPAVLSMTFGVSVCTAANIRNEDDWWNWFYASLVTGAANATMHGNSIGMGVLTAVPLMLGAAWYQYFRNYYLGTQGRVLPKIFSGGFAPLTGPLGWKYLPLGDATQTDLGPCQDRSPFTA